jgi:hypothetical protein
MAITAIDYLKAHDLDRLKAAVNDAIGEGAQPSGAPFRDADGRYVQTVVTVEAEEA